MRIESIQFRQITHFSDLKLKFHYHNKPITLIFGEQSSGKTSVLKFTYQALTWFSARYKDLRTAGLVMLDQEIRQEHTQAKIDINILFPQEIGCLAESSDVNNNNTHSCDWQLFKTLNNNNIGISRVYTEKLEQLIELYQKAIHKDKLQGLPLIAYYPSERFINEVNLLSKNNPLIFQTSNAYETTAIPYTTFSRFFEWFREISDIENAQIAQLIKQVVQDQSSDNPSIDLTEHLINIYAQMHAPSLHALKTAIYTIIPDITELELHFYPKLQMMVTYKGKSILFQQLSNSIRNWIALIGDIVRRLCILNPYSLFPCLEGEGILLIDQIDHQLDDATASSILSKLNNAFPRLQIIATTARNELLANAEDFQCLKLENYQIQEIDMQTLHSNFAHIYDHLHETLNESSYISEIESPLNKDIPTNVTPETLVELIQNNLTDEQRHTLIEQLNQNGNITIEHNLHE